MKKRQILTLVLILCLTGIMGAEPWRYTADASLSMSQNAYSDNWTGSELSSITWVASSNSTAEKQLSPIMNDKTTLKLAFGQTHTQKINSTGDKYWAKPDKSTDKIDLESVLKFTLQTYVDPFVSGRVESQFLDLSDPDKTRTLNPAKLTETAGISRTLIKQDYQNLNTRLGAAFRQNIDREKLDVVSGDRKTFTTNDGGIEFITEYTKVFKPKEISYKSRLQVFQALFNSKEDELPTDDWKTADVTWEHSLSTKLWSIVTLSLDLKFLYDKELDKKTQYKETLALGVTYQLF